MNTITKWFKVTIGTFFFTGFFPVAPGTAGSVAAAALLFFFKDDVSIFFLKENVSLFLLAYLAFLALATYVSNGAKEIYGKDDPGQIVIDEVAGILITFFLIPLTWRTILLGLVLFRFFDIVKPYPVHKFEEMDEGLGVVMDDVVAGIYANISLVTLMMSYEYIRAFI